MPDTMTAPTLTGSREELKAVAREDLAREASFTLVRFDAEGGEAGDSLTLDGIGAVFNTVTVIDSWEGNFEEVIAPGAFKRTLRETRPKMQFDHGLHPVIGSIPIGTFEEGYPREEDTGLRVRARLHDNWMTVPVRDAIQSGAVDGMSFRFSVVNETWHSAEGRSATSPGKKLSDPEEILHGILMPSEDGLLRRVLKELKMREVGPVVWPQYTETSVSIRSRVTIDLADPSSLADRATQETLARALFMTERVRAEGPQSSDTPDVHPAPVEEPHEEVRSADEAPGPEVSEESPGEHPTEPPTDPRRASRVEALFARYDAATTGSDNTRRLLFDDFNKDGGHG